MDVRLGSALACGGCDRQTGSDPNPAWGRCPYLSIPLQSLDPSSHVTPANQNQPRLVRYRLRERQPLPAGIGSALGRRAGCWKERLKAASAERDVPAPPGSRRAHRAEQAQRTARRRVVPWWPCAADAMWLRARLSSVAYVPVRCHRAWAPPRIRPPSPNSTPPASRSAPRFAPSGARAGCFRSRVALRGPAPARGRVCRPAPPPLARNRLLARRSR